MSELIDGNILLQILIFTNQNYFQDVDDENKIYQIWKQICNYYSQNIYFDKNHIDISYILNLKNEYELMKLLQIVFEIMINSDKRDIYIKITQEMDGEDKEQISNNFSQIIEKIQQQQNDSNLQDNNVKIQLLDKIDELESQNCILQEKIKDFQCLQVNYDDQIVQIKEYKIQIETMKLKEQQNMTIENNQYGIQYIDENIMKQEIQQLQSQQQKVIDWYELQKQQFYEEQQKEKKKIQGLKQKNENLEDQLKTINHNNSQQRNDYNIKLDNILQNLQNEQQSLDKNKGKYQKEKQKNIQLQIEINRKNEIIQQLKQDILKKEKQQFNIQNKQVQDEHTIQQESDKNNHLINEQKQEITQLIDQINIQNNKLNYEIDQKNQIKQEQIILQNQLNDLKESLCQKQNMVQKYQNKIQILEKNKIDDQQVQYIKQLQTQIEELKQMNKFLNTNNNCQQKLKQDVQKYKKQVDVIKQIKQEELDNKDEEIKFLANILCDFRDKMNQMGLFQE